MWAKLNGVELNGVKVVDQHDDRGASVMARCDMKGQGTTLMKVPRELNLSKDLVWEYAKSDHHLRELLEAFGDFTRVGLYSL